MPPTLCVLGSGEMVCTSSWRGSTVLHKLDQKLFQRATKGASQVKLRECHGQFADDASLLAKTRRGVEQATVAYIDMARVCKHPKDVGVRDKDGDGALNSVCEREADSVQGLGFPYLGSLVSSSERVDMEVLLVLAGHSERCLGQCLRTPSPPNKRYTRPAYIPLYGSEYWTLRTPRAVRPTAIAGRTCPAACNMVPHMQQVF